MPISASTTTPSGVLFTPISPSFSKGSSPSTADDARAAGAVALRFHPDLHRDALVHLLHVGDHPYPASQRLQAVQGLHGQRQRLRVEAAEPLVDKQRLDGELAGGHGGEPQGQRQGDQEGLAAGEGVHRAPLVGHVLDRKSTRLNSSHVRISYAVFCLKKKKKKLRLPK